MDEIRAITSSVDEVIESMNEHPKERFKTRGERTGSGMGHLLEAMWGYEVNRLVDGIEVVWLEHQYNDFATISEDTEWTEENELYRIEAKTMIQSADESKAHFDPLGSEVGEDDLLLLLLWDWVERDEFRVYPKVMDVFVGSAADVIELRDDLHVVRGGSFVQDCPDCDDSCQHIGEPLNSNGSRERASGPPSYKPSGSSYAANFGGLVRMLYTRSDESKVCFDNYRLGGGTAAEYIEFLHDNFPEQEANQYSKGVWVDVANEHGLESDGLKEDVVRRVRSSVDQYGHELSRIRRERMK